MADSCSGPSVSSSCLLLYECGGYRGISHIDFPSCLSSTCLSQSSRGQGCPPAPQRGFQMILSSTIKCQCTARDPMVYRVQVTRRLSIALSCTLAVGLDSTHVMGPHFAVTVPAPSGTLSLNRKTRYVMLLQRPIPPLWTLSNLKYVIVLAPSRTSELSARPWST